MKLTNDLVVLDLEATGTWVAKDKIIEIAMIKCSVDGQKEEYIQRVNPGIPIPPFVCELTGISNEDIEESPKFKEIVSDVLEFIGKSDLAGFNVEKFDLPLLERECAEAGADFQWRSQKVFDAQKVYHINEKRDLTAAYQFYCDKSLENAHSALADTKATLEIFEAQTGKYSEDGTLDSLAQFDYKKSAEFYDEERKFRWWNGKLYMMFGKYAKRYSLEEIVQKDKGYLEWILSADFSSEIKALVSDAINGRFPIYTEENEQTEKPEGQTELFSEFQDDDKE